MKKLMIAAAAAAMVGGAYAKCGDAACLVYDLKFNLKTLGTKSLTCKDLCGDSRAYYLDTVTRTLQGYAWSCEYDCENAPELTVAIWEPKAQLGWVLLGSDTEIAVNGGVILPRYGKKATKAAFWASVDVLGKDPACEDSDYVVKGLLDFAGVDGKVGYEKTLNDCILKSISGYALGYVNVDVRCGKTKTTTKKNWCDDDTTTQCCADYIAVYTSFCDCDFSSWCDEDNASIQVLDTDDMVPAVGTWSMKYNKSLSTQTKYTVADKVPAYCKE